MIINYLRLAWDALLLRDRAYTEMRESSNAFTRGLILIVLVALVFSIPAIVGKSLERLTSPDPGKIQEVVRQELTAMPWYKQAQAESGRQFQEGFEQGYNAWWQFFGNLIFPNPIISALGIIFNPISLIIGWLIYGLLAFLFARLLGGKGSLGQTYGTTALAVSPQLLGVLTFLPYVAVAGLSTWSVVCNYLALKHTHHLTPGRTLWATVLPYVIQIVLAVLVGALVAFTIAMVVGGGR